MKKIINAANSIKIFFLKLIHYFSIERESRRIAKSLSQKTIPDLLKNYLLQNVDIKKYKFHVYFNFSVPFSFSPRLIDKFLIDPQRSQVVSEMDCAFDIFFSGELEDQIYYSQMNNKDYKFHREGTRIHVFACSNYFEKDKFNDPEVLILMERMAHHRINQFVMSYIAKTNDRNITLVSPQLMDTNTTFYLFNNELSNALKYAFLLKEKPSDPKEVANFEDFQKITTTAYERDLVNDFTFTFYKRTNSWTLFHNALYTESIMLNVSFAEEFFCKSIIILSETSDNDSIYKKTFSKLLEDYLPRLFSVESFRKKTHKNDHNKDIYNFFHYSYTLRNKTTHGRYMPSYTECHIALSATDNFIYFLKNNSNDMLKNVLDEYRSQLIYVPDIESEIETLAMLYPTLYKS